MGTMLEWCSMAVIRTSSPAPTLDAAVGLRDEVDGLGCAADKDDFARISGVQELPHRLPRRIVRLSGAHAERVNTAMNVGVACGCSNSRWHRAQR
jgi:hypothetical protein